MKPFFLFLATLFAINSAQAQTYQVKYKTEIRYQTSDAYIKAPSPEQYDGCLIYQNGESNYTRKKIDHSVLNAKTAASSSKMKINLGEGLKYKNHHEKIILDQENALGEPFIVKLPYAREWTFINKTEKIGSYNCRIAQYSEGKYTYKVWYCMDIPISDGPGELAGLPGLILKVEGSNITTVIASLSTLKEKQQIERPSKGKIVSNDELIKIINSKVEELIRGM